jgi:hypothetical protein
MAAMPRMHRRDERRIVASHESVLGLLRVGQLHLVVAR